MSALVPVLTAAVLFLVDPPSGRVFPQARLEGADSLQSYLYHEGFHAGSLRSEVPLPIYHQDPAQLWNRLFATFYMRKLKPGGTASWPPVPLLPPDEQVPADLTPALSDLWRQTYNHDATRRIEGGDILDAPLLPRSDAILAEKYSGPALKILDEFLNQDGQLMIRDPLRRALLQRDLWPVFDLLDRIAADPKQSVDQEARRQEFRQKIALVMKAVALTQEEFTLLPDNYALAVQSGRFTHEHEFNSSLDYLPEKLLDRSGDWVEVNRGGPEPQRGVFAHENAFGFEGRSWFRVFCRFPPASGGREAVERLLSRPLSRDQNGFLSEPDVPPGTEVALVRVMLAIDRDGGVHPTKIVESAQLRLIRYGDGEVHEDTDSGRGQNFYEYEMRRAALFADKNDGGLRRVPNTAPQYHFGVWPFSTVSSFSSNRWTYESFPAPLPLHQVCSICHRHDNRPVHTQQNTLRPWPEKFPFGLGSVLTLLSKSPSPTPEEDSDKLSDAVISWKKAQPSFQRLQEYWANQDPAKR